METPFPSLTSTWHNDSYPSISSLRPELSAAGKTVIIVGAGSGIRRATAASFDHAGASKIILIASVTNEAISSVAAIVGLWNVLVLAADYLSQPATIMDSLVDEWLYDPRKSVPSHHQPFPRCYHQPGLSAHTSSKLAVVKIMDYIAAEALSVFAAALSPGMIHTAIIDKLGIDAATLPFDSVGLPANFMVWLTSPEASLNGRYVYANWNVAELKARAEEIKSGAILTPGVTGWPFAPA
ncbi:hypothetical protein BDV06DRAFT_234562 [Aspergillus oleicola]